MVSGSGKKGKNANLSVKIEENWEPDVTVPPIVDDNVDDEPEHNFEQNSRQTKDIVAELCKQRAIPSVLELQFQEYFQQHPEMRPLPPSESQTADIDLADLDEETWIIQCPATIDVKAELLEKKINLSAGRSTIKHCSVPLEAHVQINSEERVIGLLSGSRVKSFVPAGFVRINQALPSLEIPATANMGNTNQITVPYPEEIRERHPLLGYDFKDHMMLPKRVRKQLSFAQQKAALMYQNAGKVTSKKKSHGAVKDSAVAATDDQQSSVSMKSKPVAQATASKTKKRKQPPEEAFVLPGIVKQEPLSPKRKKGKTEGEVQTVTVKKEVAMEDDISWLLNI